MANFDVDLTDVAAKSTMDAHIANTSNPHGVTKAQVGLGSVPNTDATNPANITQSASYRFTTDAEKAAWNAVIGGSVFQSTWNATTNSPALVSSTGTKGYYYIVATAGSTNLDGITDWKVGDWAIYDGSVWRKVDNTDAVSSVNGLTGAVSLDTSNVPDTSNKRYVTDADLVKLGNTSGTNSGNETASTIGTLINGASEKTTPVDADMVGLMDSADSNVLKKLSWLSLRTALAALFAPKYTISEISYTGGDQTNNSTPPTVQDVHSSTEITASADGWYEGEYSGNYTAAATTTGIGLGVYTSGGLVTSYFSATVNVDAGTGDKGTQAWSFANNILAAASSRTTSAGGNHFVVRFRMKVTTPGTVRLRFINEVAGSAVTITSVRGMLQRIE